MRRKVRKGFLLNFVLLCVWTLSVSAQTDPQKVTVRVQGATIHARADAASEVIEKPAVGTVHEVIRKTGEWYEIKVPSSLGMTITGFIHEKFLKEPEPAAAPPGSNVQTPASGAPAQPGKTKKGFISLGVLYQRQMGYDYEYVLSYYQTTRVVYDSADDMNAFGFHVGGGFFLIENILELDLGFRYASATAEGMYGLDWPVDQTTNEHAEAPLDHKFSETMINVGLNYYLLREGQTRPYLGGGISYVNGKVEMLEDFSFNDVSQLEIGNPKLASESVSTVGFYGKAGVDIAVSESMAVFGEGRYLLALKKEVPHPFGTEVAGKDDPVEIDMGGISVMFGVKFRF